MSAESRNVFTPYSAERKAASPRVSSQPGQRALLLFPQTEHIAVGVPLASHVCVSGYSLFLCRFGPRHHWGSPKYQAFSLASGPWALEALTNLQVTGTVNGGHFFPHGFREW